MSRESQRGRGRDSSSTRERHRERSTSTDRSSGMTNSELEAEREDGMRPRSGRRGNSGDHGPEKPDREPQRARRRRLRDEGRCFHCESSGHLLKDCPERNVAHPTASLQAATMDLGRVEVHRAMKEAASLGLMAMSFDMIQGMESTADALELVDELEGDLSGTEVNGGADSAALLLEASGMPRPVGHEQRGMLPESEPAPDTAELLPSCMQKGILPKYVPSPTARLTESLEGAGDGEMGMEGEKPEALLIDMTKMEATERGREGENPEPLLPDAGMMVAAGGTDDVRWHAVDVRVFPQGGRARRPGHGHGTPCGNGELEFPDPSKTFNKDMAPSGSGTSTVGKMNSQGTPSSASPNGRPPQAITGAGTPGKSTHTTRSTAAAASASTRNAGSNGSSVGILMVETTSVTQGSNDAPGTGGEGRDELGDEDADHDMEEVHF